MSDEQDSWLSGIGVDVDGILDTVQNTASNAVEAVEDFSSAPISPAADFGGEISDGISSVASAAKQVVVDTFDSASDGVSRVVGEVKEVVEDAIDEVVETVSDATNSVLETVDDAVDAVEEAVEDALSNNLSALSDVTGAPDDGPSRVEQDTKAINSLSTEEPDRDKETDDAVAKGLGKVAEAALKKFRATNDGKKIEAFAKDQLDKIPTVAKIAIPGTLIASALAGLAATHQESPLTESPDIPLPSIGPVEVSAKVTWKGPVDKPSEAAVTFTFEIPLGEKSKPRVLEQDGRGGASGGGGSGNFRPPLKEGQTVLIANFTFGKFNLDNIPREIARRSDGSSGLVQIVVYYPSAPDTDDEETQREKNGEFQDLAQERATTLKRALEQLMPTFKGRITAGIQPIERAFDAGLRPNVAVFFTAQSR